VANTEPAQHLKAEGQAILLVDKHVDALLKFADCHVVIEKGCTVWTGTSAELARMRAWGKDICRCERCRSARARKSGDKPAANEQNRKGAANRREGKSCVTGVGGHWGVTQHGNLLICENEDEADPYQRGHSPKSEHAAM